MMKILTLSFFITLTLISCKPKLTIDNSDNLRQRGRNNYNTIMPYVNGYIPFNRENYLYGSIKSISEQAFRNRNTHIDSIPEMYLNHFKIYNYDNNRRLLRTDNYNESGEKVSSRYCFGKGFIFFDNEDYSLVIDSSNFKLKYIANDNEEYEYNLNSDYIVKDVNRIIKDSSKITTTYSYQKELLKSIVNRQKTESYNYDSQKRITQYTRLLNRVNSKAKFDSIPESIIKYSYEEDTIRITKKNKSGQLENSKMILLSENTAIPIESSSQEFSRNHHYNNDLSLIWTKFIMYDNRDSLARDSFEILYKYEIDNYGNWTKRFDNGNEKYTREYEYDSLGNWIRMIELENKLTIKEIHRTYEYTEE